MIFDGLPDLVMWVTLVYVGLAGAYLLKYGNIIVRVPTIISPTIACVSILVGLKI